MKIANYISSIYNEAYKLKASDIHFKPNNSQVEILFRIKQQIVHQATIEEEQYIRISRYLKYKANLDLGLKRVPQDGAYETMFEQTRGFVRISVIPLINGESIVIRLLASQTANDQFSIAYNPSSLQAIYDTIVSQNGLFIFTGPTGSGKSTSMYTLLQLMVAKLNRKVICIEDPVEILIPEFTQIQINESAGLNYSVALKASLRHDPDIIMIGEIRDEQTAANVVRAALTGHTVISTMHTKNKLGVIERFTDFGFKPSEIRSSLVGVSNQRLTLDSERRIKAVFDIAIDQTLNQLIDGSESSNITKYMSENKLVPFKH